MRGIPFASSMGRELVASISSGFVTEQNQYCYVCLWLWGGPDVPPLSNYILCRKEFYCNSPRFTTVVAFSNSARSAALGQAALAHLCHHRVRYYSYDSNSEGRVRTRRNAAAAEHAQEVHSVRQKPTKSSTSSWGTLQHSLSVPWGLQH
jgi:hypothetical protein